MAVKQFFIPFLAAVRPTNIGAPGAKAYFYATGTTTKRTIYSDADLTVSLANPVTADGAGRFPNIYLNDDLTYKLVLKDKAGATLYTADPYFPGQIGGTADLDAINDAQNEIAQDAAQISQYVADFAQEVAVVTDLADAIGLVPTSGLSLTAANRTALASLATDRPAIVKEAGREAVFVFEASDHNADVAADPTKENYVAPSSDTTGASGAWVRKFGSNTLDLVRGGTATIASGAISVDPSNSFFAVATEGATATDDLDTINGGIPGRVIVLRASSSAQTITLKSGGNIDISTDIAFTRGRCASLIYDSLWHVVSSPAGSSTAAATRTALSNADASVKSVYLAEAGREGTFVWDSSNMSAKVTADTAQGVYIPPATATSGASGAWVRKFDGPLRVHWFGAKGDGLVGNTATGTDDTAAFNAAVQMAITLGIGKVLVQSGKTYRIDGTIKLGITSGFSSVIVEGSLGHASGSAAGVATLYHTAKDRPCFNISRGRGSGVRRLDIVGQNSINDTNFANITFRSNSANYVTNSCQDTARAPYCAVAVDGDGLTAPGTPYGGMTYTGTGQGTSDWFVEDCSISNFVVGVACQPNHDSNGDFGSLRSTRFNFCKVGVSFGNANARSSDLSRTNFYWCYTCIDGSNYHNTNKGNLAGELANIHANYVFQIVDAALNYSKPVLFTSLYCEGTIRIGKLIGASSRSPITFAGCTFTLESAEVTNESYVDTALDYVDTVKFDGCAFTIPYEFLTFNGDARFSNCSMLSVPYGSMTGAKLSAFNVCGGIIVRSQFIEVTARSRAFRDNNHIDSWGALHGDDVYNSSNIYAERIGYGSTTGYTQPLAKRVILAGSGGISGVSVSGKTLTFTKAGHGMEVGGILDITDVGASTFVVTAVSGNDVTADAICGYSRSAGTYALINFTSIVGYVYIPPGLAFKVTGDFYVATTSGSSTAQIKDGTGATVASAAGLSSSTKLFWTANLHPLSPFPVKATVSSVDAATGIITFSANAIRTGLYRLAPNLAVIS